MSLVLCPIVAESAAANRVNDDEEDEEDDVDHSHLLPVSLQAFQKPSFARLAAVAQSVHIIGPRCAVWIGRIETRWPSPTCGAHIDEITFHWRLAASRLKKRLRLRKDGRKF